MDDLRKIRGVFFTPAIVEEVIRSQFPEVTEFETVLTKEEVIRGQFPEVVEFETILTQKEVMPALTLRVEFDPSMGENQIKELAGRIRERLKIRSNLTFEIEIVKPGDLPRYTLKSSRFKDLSKK